MRIEATKDSGGYKLLALSRPGRDGKTVTWSGFADYEKATGKLRIFERSEFKEYAFKSFAEAIKWVFSH